MALPNKLFTIKETCEFLGISRSTLYRWVNSGAIRGYILGEGINRNSSIRFADTELERFLDNGEIVIEDVEE